MAKLMTARFPGTCRACGAGITRGTTITFAGKGRAYHERCYGDVTRPHAPTHRERFGKCEDAPCCGCCS